jgi:hypothetical protein
MKFQAVAAMEGEEVLRSSFTAGGTRVFLVYRVDRNEYRLGTRWYWLTSFDNVWDACDAFEALELTDGDEREIARLAKKEIIRVPRTRFAHRASMQRINYLVNSIERRLAGLRPQRCGSKGAVERWIDAHAE